MATVTAQIAPAAPWLNNDLSKEISMILQDEVQLPLGKDAVFQALNDTDVLKASIPGCEELTRHSETELEATVVVRFGPVKASFSCDVVLDPSQGPEKFSLTGSGDAGVAGFAKGGAEVDLVEQEGGTLLNYAVNIDIGGKLATVGGRLVEATSKKLARKFFSNFEEALTNRPV